MHIIQVQSLYDIFVFKYPQALSPSAAVERATHIMWSTNFLYNNQLTLSNIFQTKASLISAISGIEYMYGRTSLAAGLKLVRSKMLQSNSQESRVASQICEYYQYLLTKSLQQGYRSSIFGNQNQCILKYLFAFRNEKQRL